MAEKKNADGWLATEGYSHVTIVDPDGWDRSNFDASWAEEITEEEFQRRLLLCTVLQAV